jgi:hypothetical protein
MSWTIDRKIVTTKLDGTGAGNNQIRNDNAAATLVIFQLSLITTPTSSGATCTVTPPIGIVDTSYFAGTGDIAWGAWMILPDDYLTLTWANGPANGVGVASYYFAEITP